MNTQVLHGRIFDLTDVTFTPEQVLLLTEWRDALREDGRQQAKGSLVRVEREEGLGVNVEAPPKGAAIAMCCLGLCGVVVFRASIEPNVEWHDSFEDEDAPRFMLRFPGFGSFDSLMLPDSVAYEMGLMQTMPPSRSAELGVNYAVKMEQVQAIFSSLNDDWDWTFAQISDLVDLLIRECAA